MIDVQSKITREKKRLQGSSENYMVALAGNPNVGKSTVFNALTGMRQHTGNWSGKTVGCAYGEYNYDGVRFRLVDLPGCYSLHGGSGEELIARDYLLNEHVDAVVTVCDATCLERTLIFALQVAEMGINAVICLNLMDEAERKGIKAYVERLGEMIGSPCVGVAARAGEGLDGLKQVVLDICRSPIPYKPPFLYSDEVEDAISAITERMESGARCNGECLCGKCSAPRGSARYRSVREIEKILSTNSNDAVILPKSPNNDMKLSDVFTDMLIREELLEEIYNAPIRCAEELARVCVTACEERNEESETEEKSRRPHFGKRLEERLDGAFMGRRGGLVMAALFALILWITVSGANYPSELLRSALFWVEGKLYSVAVSIGIPEMVRNALILGIYRTVAWVVSVMLPPMAIFFPLFTLLEDFGYLPRAAFVLDPCLKRCGSCGKQALTMCMGLGCNAVGVEGCRIIDSPRERKIAILTNAFMPCNGRFPTVIALTVIFCAPLGFGAGMASALAVTGALLLGVFLTFTASKLLSSTLLRGESASFVIELPPYRAPKVWSVLVRSLADRTAFVLGRALMVAAPAGLIIWLLGNLTVGDTTLLRAVSGAIDPFARMIGLDGVILLAFILGLPANEIVLPIAIMAYSEIGAVTDLSNAALFELLSANGWTVKTAICTCIFCICHFPCSTTLMTVKKETGSVGYAVIAALLPTAFGVLLCFAVNLL